METSYSLSKAISFFTGGEYKPSCAGKEWITLIENLNTYGYTSDESIGSFGW